MYYLRWVLSGACLLISIINSIVLCRLGYSTLFVYLIILPILGFIVFLCLHYQTGRDYNDRIKFISKTPPSFKEMAEKKEPT
jgi:hypothetical protein